MKHSIQAEQQHQAWIDVSLVLEWTCKQYVCLVFQESVEEERRWRAKIQKVKKSIVYHCVIGTKNYLPNVAILMVLICMYRNWWTPHKTNVYAGKRNGARCQALIMQICKKVIFYPCVWMPDVSICVVLNWMNAVLDFAWKKWRST